jgi:hypothetical protein
MKVEIKLGKVKKFGIGWCNPHRMAADNAEGGSVRYRVKGVTHAHLGPICYHSEPSDVPYSPNQFLGWDFYLVFLTANWL